MKIKSAFLVSFALLVTVVSTGQTTAGQKTKTNDEWSKYKIPAVEFVNEDTSANGKLFALYIQNPDSLEKAVDLKVCKLLYKTPSEVPKVSKILLVVKSMDGVAYTSGLKKPTEKTTVVSSNYIKSISDRMKDPKPIINEIAGVVTHETVHIFQKSSKKQSADHGSVIEGIADAIRYYAGVDSITRRHKGGTWTGSYTTTGFFIVWLQEKYDPDFLYKLNKFVGNADKFSWDEAMMKLLNKHVQALWDEYQAAI